MATKQKIEAAAAGILQHRGITIEQLCEQYLAGLSRDAPDWTRTSDLRFRRRGPLSGGVRSSPVASVTTPFPR